MENKPKQCLSNSKQNNEVSIKAEIVYKSDINDLYKSKKWKKVYNEKEGIDFDFKNFTFNIISPP